MSEKTRSLPTGLVRTVVLSAFVLVGLSLSPSLLAQGVDDALMEDIRSLVLNTWDQKMARQYQMGLEMPVSEIEARLEIEGRWAKAIEAGAFGADAKLPDGFADQYTGMAKMVKEAKGKDDADLDPVLQFLEATVPALEKASGLSIAPPV